LFVAGVQDGYVSFGYQGQRTAEIARGITVGNAAWFFGYARRIPEASLVEALRVSGANEDEARRFARAITDRISQLGRTVEAG
jgi:hypothetical protein